MSELTDVTDIPDVKDVPVARLTSPVWNVGVIPVVPLLELEGVVEQLELIDVIYSEHRGYVTIYPSRKSLTYLHDLGLSTSTPLQLFFDTDKGCLVTHPYLSSDTVPKELSKLIHVVEWCHNNPQVTDDELHRYVRICQDDPELIGLDN